MSDVQLPIGQWHAWQPTTPQGQVLREYRLPLDCPVCGGDLEHRNMRSCGTEAIAVAACVPCEREFVLSVQLRQLPRPSWSERRSMKREAARA